MLRLHKSKRRMSYWGQLVVTLQFRNIVGSMMAGVRVKIAIPCRRAKEINAVTLAAATVARDVLPAQIGPLSAYALENRSIAGQLSQPSRLPVPLTMAVREGRRVLLVENVEDADIGTVANEPSL